MARKKDYEIGRNKPPVHTRFKPGQSGNKKGRPKGSRNIATDLNEELNEMMSITEGGKTRKLSKRRIMIKATVNKAIKGDVRAVNTVIVLNDRSPNQPGVDDTPGVMPVDDAAVLEAFTLQNLADAKQLASDKKKSKPRSTKVCSKKSAKPDKARGSKTKKGDPK